MKRFLKFLSAFLLFGAAAVYGLIFWPLRDQHPALQVPQGAIAVRSATIYVAPDKPPLNNDMNRDRQEANPKCLQRSVQPSARPI
jgi:hypothetical protein